MKRANLADPHTATLPQSVQGPLRTYEGSLKSYLQERWQTLPEDVRDFMTKYEEGWLARAVLLIARREPTADAAMVVERLFLWISNGDEHEPQRPITEAPEKFRTPSSGRQDKR